ncbi:hypothetical protein C8Q74DRAFT_1287193 [Fomes fomentarius]|nr:hypothetical protein C8Q74DRAFT_1287193 [Fomes fomentarius]
MKLTVLSEDQRGTATANVDVPQGKEFEARVHSIKASPWASWSKNNQKGSDVSTVIESWVCTSPQNQRAHTIVPHSFSQARSHKSITIPIRRNIPRKSSSRMVPPCVSRYMSIIHALTHDVSMKTNMISSTPQWLEDSGQVETVNMDANGTLDAGCPSLIYPITQTTAESIGILGAHADVASDAAFEKNGAIGVHHPAQLKQEIQDLKEARRALLYEADQIVMKITDIEDKLHGPLQTWDEDGSTGEDAKLEAQAMSINRTARVSPESTKPITDEQISDIIVYQYLAAQFEDLHHMHPNALSTTSAGAESSASACATRATSPAISIFDDLAEELTEELSEWEEVPCEEADNDSSDSHIMQPRAQLLPSEISDYVTIPPVEDA